MNNFDSSTSGVNLEVSCFWDNDLSCMYFEENFQRLENDQFLFVDNGNFSDQFDCTDLDNYDLKSGKNKDLLKYIVDKFYNCIENVNQDSLIYFSKYAKQLNKLELIGLVENAFPYDYEDFLTYNFTPLYEVLTVRGHCQGDQATVIFTHESIKEYNFDNREQFLSMMQKIFREFIL